MLGSVPRFASESRLVPKVCAYFYLLRVRTQRGLKTIRALYVLSCNSILPLTWVCPGNDFHPIRTVLGQTVERHVIQISSLNLI